MSEPGDQGSSSTPLPGKAWRRLLLWGLPLLAVVLGALPLGSLDDLQLLSVSARVEAPGAPGPYRPPAAGFVGPQAAPSFGSSVPCAVPLRWRLAGVDPRFELRDDEARRAVREAGALWERATGEELFVHDPEHGFPVLLEFDDRQATLRLRRRIMAELDDADQALEVRRGELAQWQERLEAASAEYEERRDSLQRRTAAHNAEVVRWNERGGAPQAVRPELDRRRAALEVERRSLQEQAEELRRIQEWIQAEVDRLNRGDRERNQRAESLQRELPVAVAEAGRYAESVRRGNGRVVSVDREIRIYRFANHQELVLVLAHELGHALGLGHPAAPGAVMSEVAPQPSDSAAPLELHQADLEMLRVRCPGLGAEAPGPGGGAS